MRWIFFTLILANLLTFAWGLVATSNEVPGYQRPATLKNPYQSFPEIELLSERDNRGIELGSSTVERVARPEPVPSSLVEPVDAPGRELNGRALCEIVGPFDTTETAADFVQRLAAIEVQGALKDLDLPAGPGYWVYLEPVATRREALRLLSELQAKRIDSYVIPKGDLANGISLGMFSKKSLADAREKEMLELGLTPKVEQIERSYREIWVMLAPGEEAKMSDLTWNRLMEGAKSMERRQNYCLDVASQ